MALFHVDPPTFNKMNLFWGEDFSFKYLLVSDNVQADFAAVLLDEEESWERKGELASLSSYFPESCRKAIY